MKLEINLDETYGWSEDSVTNIIMEEVKDEIRRAVKRHLRAKDKDIHKAIEAYASHQATLLRKEVEEKVMGLSK